MVIVKLRSALADFYQTDSIEVEYYPSMTIRTVLKKSKIDPGSVGLIMVNGATRKQENKIADSSVLEVYPIFGGG